MKLKEFIEILQDESIDQESEEEAEMTNNEFLTMTITDVLEMLVDDGSDSLEAKITNSEGKGILIKVSYESVEVE